MKLTNTSNMKAFKPGMTLLELTVVILVLLTLISILFIGARAWKKGSDRAASILQIRNVQQAVRSFSNMNARNIGDAINPAVGGDIFGPGKFIENDPTAGSHPAGTGYAFTLTGGGALIPPVGTLYMITSGAGTTGSPPSDYNPTTGTTADW